MSKREPTPKPPRTDRTEIERVRQKRYQEARKRVDAHAESVPAGPLLLGSAALTTEELQQLADPEGYIKQLLATHLPEHPGWVWDELDASISYLNTKLSSTSATTAPGGTSTDDAPSGPLTPAALKQLIAELASPFRMPDLPSGQSAASEPGANLGSLVECVTAAFEPVPEPRALERGDWFLSMDDLVRLADNISLPLYDADGGTRCRCCGRSTSAMREVSARGLEAIATHNASVRRLFDAVVAGAPTPQEYSQFFMRVFVPSFNATHRASRRCTECGLVFALRDDKAGRDARYCDNATCGARARNRGRDKAFAGRSELEKRAETKVSRAGVRLQKHMKNCIDCKKGAYCDKRERLLVVDMNSTAVVFEAQRPPGKK